MTKGRSKLRDVGPPPAAVAGKTLAVAICGAPARILLSDTKDRSVYVLDGRHSIIASKRSLAAMGPTTSNCSPASSADARSVPISGPQTGPEGGGSKADSETYAVADEIAHLSAGERRARTVGVRLQSQRRGRKRSAATSPGIVGTGRSYDWIIYVTSRFARAKDQARLEDEGFRRSTAFLSPFMTGPGSPEEIIENDRKDLAFNYLGVSEAKNDPLRLGPTDYSRCSSWR